MKYYDISDVIISINDSKSIKIESSIKNKILLKLNKKYRFVCLVVFIHEDKGTEFKDFDNINRVLILLDNTTKKIYSIYDGEYYEAFGDYNYLILLKILEKLELDKTFSNVVNLLDDNTEKNHFLNLNNIELLEKEDVKNIVYIDWEYFLLDNIISNINNIDGNLIKNIIYSILQKYKINDYLNGLTLKIFSRLEEFNFKMNSYLTDREYYSLCKDYFFNTQMELIRNNYSIYMHEELN